ncbi:hypothetical protein JCM10049v2_002674 [Rhodotorula toruloides]
MSTPIVFASAPSRSRSLFGDQEQDDMSKLLGLALNQRKSALPSREVEGLRKMLGGTSLGGTSLGGTGLSKDCDCGACPYCRGVMDASYDKARRNLRREAPVAPLSGAATPSSSYLRRTAVPSKFTTDVRPLVVIAIDGVLDAPLPYHLQGGYDDVLSRPYLRTFFDYLLSRESPYCFCFYSSLPRKQALRTLEELNLPTGGPERDERDGCVGLFAADDTHPNFGGKGIKDLEVIWKELEKEEGIRWGVENTVVITCRDEFPLQPFNYILCPETEYLSSVAPADDIFLLLAIACLKDLETESNFAAHIKEFDWHKPQIWSSRDEHSVNERNSYLLLAVRTCAVLRINIKAFRGNLRKSG